MSRGAGRGNVEIDGVITTTSQYKLSDMDSASDPSYYGYIDPDGNWYIMQITGGVTFRYCKGDGGYTDNWTGRAGLSYGYYNDTF